MYFKKILFAITFILATINTMAQSINNYEVNWKKVEAFEKKGLTKSALGVVLEIYAKAQKDENISQQIKSCIYQIKYRNEVEEDSHENNIFFVDTLIDKAKLPAKNILQSMQAQMFWQYIQNNRWKFRDRTKLENEKSNDIATWSLDKLYQTVTKLYKASLQNETLLKAIKINEFDAIIIKGENTRELRSTLYDFLAHRAINYFTTGENDLTKPAYQFTLKNEKIFAPVNEFVNAKFITKDTESLQYSAILILQNILKFHLNDANPNALIDADLIRLNFVKEYGVMQNKIKLYEEALMNIENKYSTNPLIADAMFLRANIYREEGEKYKAFLNIAPQFQIKKAKELYEKAYTKFPNSSGGIQSKNQIENNINRPFINLNTEKVNLPNTPFRTLVEYKNVSTLYVKIIKTNKEDIAKFNSDYSYKQWQIELLKAPTLSFSVALPNLNDYQHHSTEIKIDGLENGMYFIFASIKNDFSQSENIIAKQLTYISNISLIKNNNSDYYILHRNTGLPLAGSTVQVWQNEYDYKQNKSVSRKLEKYTTDKNGFFKLKSSKNNNFNYNLQLINGNDELFLDDTYYDYNYNSYPEETNIEPETFLFTDRSIYRPGQTIYFKGIVVKRQKNANKTVVVPNFKTTVILNDVNGQKVGDLKLTTNEFGSYHGTYKLPEGLMNGEFSIIDSITNAAFNFKVEEYKRPKFFVEINNPKGTYQLNDSIEIMGTAKAYAGNYIDGAKVKYNVVRKVQYPIWCYWGYFNRGQNWGSNEKMQITQGETTTNANGQFLINFKAIPDEAVDKQNQPTFYYEVSADITDVNGETRSGSTTVAVAYQMLQLNIQIPEKIELDSLKALKIKSTNLNEIEEKTTASLSIFKLKSPNKIFRTRYWKEADQHIISETDYTSYFPYDVYKNENDVHFYEVDNKVFEKNDSTNKNWEINNQLFTAGWYKLIATTIDKYGEAVKSQKYIQIINSSKNTNELQPILISKNKNTFEPNDELKYNTTTSFSDIWLIHSLSQNNENVIFNYAAIHQNNTTSFSQKITENDRGGMSINYAFVKHNNIYTGHEIIDIPWSNKELNISYETFRDKLLPGSQENWKIKISGNKSEKVAAEMLTSMYDASLDQFKPHSWSALNIWPTNYSLINWSGIGFKDVASIEQNTLKIMPYNAPAKSYDELAMQDYYINYGIHYYKKMLVTSTTVKSMPAPQADNMKLDEVVVTASALSGKVAGVKIQNKEEFKKVENKQQKNEVQIRKNFNETAFFLPNLQTDAEGNVSFSFTMPEALTQWKLMTFAHTKELANAYTEKFVVTQKPLMVQPNAPRFMREGDRMEFSAKIVNLSDSEVTGTAQLELLDAATNKPVDGWFKNVFPNQYFTIAANQSSVVKFPIEIPHNFNSGLTYRIIAKTNQNSDGEEMILPILTNRMMVTESMPLNIRNTNTKTFKFDKLLKSNSSNTLSNFALTLEYSSNPAWYAVQALPYLMEYPYECAEQTFNRFFANTLASYVSNAMPNIKSTFEKWKTTDTAALQSNLQKNQELKSALLQETPWVLEAQNEAQQKKNIALLFDMVKMSKEQNSALNKLVEMQSPNGGFVWFKGGQDDRYITQYIITGIGHLRKLNAFTNDTYVTLKPIIDKALPYLDKKIKEDYDNLIKYKANLKDDNLSQNEIQYLYMRSFFKETKIAESSQVAVNYFKSQSQKYWLSKSKYMQAMIALTLFRNEDMATPKAILKSLKENAIVNDEMGMYWKEWTNGGYYWYQAPIESQAMMIEAFGDIEKNENTINDLKTWLLKQKQTQNWKTTKATAEACYALLLNGNNWLNEEKDVTFQLGSTTIKTDKNNTEAGTGYFKTKILGEKINSEMGNIKITLSSTTAYPLQNQTTSWGGIYWQYFEDLDKITTAQTPLKLTKKLFVERNTDKGIELVAIQDGSTLKVGDKVKVRIELKVDRDMEYIHMKDMRAACMEPTNVISEYKWQDGLGYYETTKDASTNFFFNWLNRGTYIFEYPMFVTHAGNFSNGITTIQCMYAPEFTSHSEGIRVEVE